MSIQETRMDLAVRLVSRAFRASPEAETALRLTGFREAYAALADLDAGDEAWTEDTLAAAWELVADAWPRGGPLEALIRDLRAAHRTLIDTALPPPEVQRRKPRRDA